MSRLYYSSSSSFYLRMLSTRSSVYFVIYCTNLPKFTFCWSATFSNYASTDSYHSCSIETRALVWAPSGSPILENWSDPAGTFNELFEFVSTFPIVVPSTTCDSSNALYSWEGTFSLTEANTKPAPFRWAKYLSARQIVFLRADSY